MNTGTARNLQCIQKNKEHTILRKFQSVFGWATVDKSKTEFGYFQSLFPDGRRD